MIDPKLTEVEDVYAHLQALNFILEHVVVSGMLAWSPDEAQRWRDSIMRQMRSATVPEGMDLEQALRICKRAADLGDNFMAKAAAREELRRAGMPE